MLTIHIGPPVVAEVKNEIKYHKQGEAIKLKWSRLVTDTIHEMGIFFVWVTLNISGCLLPLSFSPGELAFIELLSESLWSGAWGGPSQDSRWNNTLGLAIWPDQQESKPTPPSPPVHAVRGKSSYASCLREIHTSRHMHSNSQNHVIISLK